MGEEKGGNPQKHGAKCLKPQKTTRHDQKDQTEYITSWATHVFPSKLEIRGWWQNGPYCLVLCITPRKQVQLKVIYAGGFGEHGVFNAYS